MVLLDDKEVVMEEKPSHLIPNNEVPPEIIRSMRHLPPAHYTFKIKSFSLLSRFLQSHVEEKNYESDVFEASGYKWKLSLYPNGDEQRGGEGHISLYLVIAEMDSLPLGWEVNVNFRLFVFDQIQDKFMTIQDGNEKIRRFHRMKTKLGFAQLLPITTFNDASNGYLVRDECVFGAEVFVLNSTGRGDCLTLMGELDKTRTWKIDNFSSLVGEIHYSDVYTVENRKWQLELYPNGDTRGKDESLSLFLRLDDCRDFPADRKTYAKFTLRIKNQQLGNHVELTGTRYFSASTCSWGWSSFMSLSDLRDASKGYLVNDTLVIELEVSEISKVHKY